MGTDPLDRSEADRAQSDIDVLARTMWGEARGLGRDGMAAIGWVVKNRAARPCWWGRDIASVCTKAAQFSCWNADDPNRAKLLAVGEADATFAVALTVAGGIVAGAIPDPTHGATHYHTVARPEWAAIWPPDWTRSMRETADDGHHVFYR